MNTFFLSVCLCLFTLNAVAGSASDERGSTEISTINNQNFWYFGAQVGAHDYQSHWKKFDVLTGRIIIGYQFEPHYSFEMNLVAYETMHFRFSFVDEESIVTAKLRHTISPELDLLFKADTKLSRHVGVYGKFGVGIWQRYFDLNIVGKDAFETIDVDESMDDVVVDVVGIIGLTLHPTKRVAMDISLTSSWHANDTDRYSLGIGFIYSVV